MPSPFRKPPRTTRMIHGTARRIGGTCRIIMQALIPPDLWVSTRRWFHHIARISRDYRNVWSFLRDAFRDAWAILCRLVFLLSFAVCGLSLAAFGMYYPFPAFVAMAVIAWRGRRHEPSDTHGSARFTTATELLQAGWLDGDDGLIVGTVGYAPPPSLTQGVRMLCNPSTPSARACEGFVGALSRGRSMSPRLIRVRGITNASTIAPTGKGKGRSCLFPNLLAYHGSCMVFDPKGELFAGTAEHRRCQFGHRIIRIDPFGVGGRGSDTYNPLDFLAAKDPFLLERCRDIGNQLVVRQGTEHEPHWNDTAENVLGALIYFICLCESRAPERTLESLCQIVSSPDKFRRAIRIMHETGHPVLEQLAGRLMWLEDRELHSAMSTVMRHVGWMQSELMATFLRRSSFDPRVLRKPATLYLILPSEFLTVMQPLLRILLGTILRVVTRRGPDESNPILFLIDEAAQIGQMRALEDAVTLYRGYGIRCWFFWQAQDQIKECFGDRANIIQANMDVTQYFGISDYQTAEEGVSKRIGDATIPVESINKTSGYSRSTGPAGPQSGNVSRSTSVTTNDISRRLVFASEVLTLASDSSVVFINNSPAILSRLVRWYDNPGFWQRRMGKQRAVGITAGVAAVLMLLASVLFARFVSTLPVPWHSTPQIYGLGSEQTYIPEP
jgi:type IV secretion system protein VirD4